MSEPQIEVLAYVRISVDPLAEGLDAFDLRQVERAIGQILATRYSSLLDEQVRGSSHERDREPTLYGTTRVVSIPRVIAAEVDADGRVSRPLYDPDARVDSSDAFVQLFQHAYSPELPCNVVGVTTSMD